MPHPVPVFLHKCSSVGASVGRREAGIPSLQVTAQTLASPHLAPGYAMFFIPATALLRPVPGGITLAAYMSVSYSVTPYLVQVLCVHARHPQKLLEPSPGLGTQCLHETRPPWRKPSCVVPPARTAPFPHLEVALRGWVHGRRPAPRRRRPDRRLAQLPKHVVLLAPAGVGWWQVRTQAQGQQSESVDQRL